MGDIADILSKKNYGEPPEIAALKKYVLEHFQANVSINVRNDAFILSVDSASLAGTLRMHSQQIIENCNITKKLIFKIG